MALESAQGLRYTAQGPHYATEGPRHAARGPHYAAQGLHYAAQGLHCVAQGLRCVAQGQPFVRFGVVLLKILGNIFLALPVKVLRQASVTLIGGIRTQNSQRDPVNCRGIRQRLHKSTLLKEGARAIGPTQLHSSPQQLSRRAGNTNDPQASDHWHHET